MGVKKALWNEVNRTQTAVLDACLAKPVRQSQLLGALAVTWARRKTGVAGARGQEIEGMRSILAGRFAGSTIRVLLAEDNVVNQKVAARMLERLGLRIDVAANGLEAVEMCGMLPYDLVLMDCQMPEMDGYEATREIRRGSWQRMPIVAMTAETRAGTRERCLEAGMDDYIAKPVKLEDLFEVVQKWAAGGRAQHHAPSNIGSQPIYRRPPKRRLRRPRFSSPRPRPYSRQRMRAQYRVRAALPPLCRAPGSPRIDREARPRVDGPGV